MFKSKDCRLAGIAALTQVMASSNPVDAILCLKNLEDPCLDHLKEYVSKLSSAINAEKNMREENV
jgi:hypothetical protein